MATYHVSLRSGIVQNSLRRDDFATWIERKASPCPVPCSTLRGSFVRPPGGGSRARARFVDLNRLSWEAPGRLVPRPPAHAETLAGSQAPARSGPGRGATLGPPPRGRIRWSRGGRRRPVGRPLCPDASRRGGMSTGADARRPAIRGARQHRRRRVSPPGLRMTDDRPSRRQHRDQCPRSVSLPMNVDRSKAPARVFTAASA